MKDSLVAHECWRRDCDVDHLCKVAQGASDEHGETEAGRGRGNGERGHPKKIGKTQRRDGKAVNEDI